MCSQLFLILVVIYKTVLAERNASCLTPNHENATCIAAISCKVIYDAVQTGKSTAIEFAKQSQCGLDTEPLLCCGSTAYPTITTTTPPTSTFDFRAIFSTPTPVEEIESLLDFSTVNLPDRSVCGLHVVEPRIFGGEITDFGEFPWTAALEFENKRTSNKKNMVGCGGTVINNRFVLTAAHCVINREFKLVRVRLGEWNITGDPDCLDYGTAQKECADPVKIMEIEETIPHPFYSASKHINDIALLRLKEDITYTDFIRPICLPPPNLPFPDPGSKVVVTGWGQTEKDEPSDVKLKVVIPLLPNTRCTEKVTLRVTANQLCAGGEIGKDSCVGDSGGPLMRIYAKKVNEQQQWFQEGVVSYGYGCGNKPAIYTRVSRYMNWIINNITE